MKYNKRPLIILAALIAVLSATTLQLPAAAHAESRVSAENQPMGQSALAIYPARTASPRDFDKLAPEGELSASAIKAKYACLMDARTGEVLFEKEGGTKAYPASTTKIMTALLALEKCSLSDEVTVSDYGKLPSDATNIDLKVGETMTVEELLYGLMLRSGNDTALALAIHISGSVSAFAELMNQKAQELGMTGTHYVNPHGLHDENHYTTAHDMALLTRAAMQNTTFKKIWGTYSYTMRATNMHSKQRTWTNTNKLINPSDSESYSYINATGGKTGYTSPAAGCLVASAYSSAGDLELIAVDLGDVQATKWSTVITMFEYGFNFYETVDLRTAIVDASVDITIDNAAADDSGAGTLSVLVVPDSGAYVTHKKSDAAGIDKSAYTSEIRLNEGLAAPIVKDQEVGKIVYLKGTEEVLVCSLLATRAVAAAVEVVQSTKPADSSLSATPAPSGAPAPSSAKSNIKKAVIYVLIALLSLVALVLIIRMINLKRGAKVRRAPVRQSQGRGKHTR